MNSNLIAWRAYYCRRWADANKIAEEPNDIVARSINYKEGGRAIDIGAGPGRDALYLARGGFIVEAITLEQCCVQRMNDVATRENLSLTVHEADASEVVFADQYDLVVSVLMLNHLSYASARKLIAKIKISVAEGGICAIATITKDSDSYRLKVGRDYFYPSAGELRSMFADWEILEYRERLVCTEAGWWLARAVENTEAELIARKPSTPRS